MTHKQHFTLVIVALPVVTHNGRVQFEAPQLTEAARAGFIHGRRAGLGTWPSGTARTAARASADVPQRAGATKAGRPLWGALFN